MESTVSPSDVYAPSEDIVAREIAGDLVIVPLAAGIGNMEDELYTLNETGRAIWGKLDGSKSIGQMAEALSAEYNAPMDEIKADVLGLMRELAERGIVFRVCGECR